uniref:G_PROTEIN_RECEP_F1_2 domain-containing protein n=1 Tax=Heligmosomoides polygyrus TaxID=6339 RepID=A0A183G6X6_HELPZ
LCRTLKFLSTFGFHLTANMQALVSVDRLIITTSMSKIAGNNRKKSYNTHLMLVIAWTLALVCALPQLYVFREGYSKNGFPQCIAIWYV